MNINELGEDRTFAPNRKNIRMKGVLKVSKEQVIDVRGKRFNTHGELHCMEMTISKDHVAGKSCWGWSLWRHSRP